MEILDRIDWTSVNWLYVAVLTALVFFSTLIGALLSFKRTFRTAVLSSLLFSCTERSGSVSHMHRMVAERIGQ
jgi:hypothetical protein